MSCFTALIPVVSWVLLNAATCVLLTIPLQHRLYFLPALLIPAAVSFKTIQYLRFLPGLSDLWGTITFIGLIHFTSVLYIKRWTLHTTNSGKKLSTSYHIWLNREWWIQMYKVATSPRLHRIPYKKVVLDQGSSTELKSNAIHRPFSMTRVIWLFVRISTNIVLNVSMAGGLLGHVTVDDFAPGKAIFLRRLLQSLFLGSTSSVSSREIMIRVWSTVSSIWTPILLLDAIHAFLAMFFIYVLRIDIPEDWPDLFGSPLEAYTLGRFWSRLWHRVHLSGYSDYSKLFLNILPRDMTQNPTVKRALMTFLLFFISGCIHQATTRQLNSGCSDYADVQFFCLNAVAVMLESALLGVVSLSSATQKGKSHGTSKDQVLGLARAVLLRLVGYMWVVSFFVWVVPKIYYPRVYCMIKQQPGMRKIVA